MSETPKMPEIFRRVRFTRAELIELRRALDLISQEDAYANVNMDAGSVKAKASARDKISTLLLMRKR